MKKILLTLMTSLFICGTLQANGYNGPEYVIEVDDYVHQNHYDQDLLLDVEEYYAETDGAVPVTISLGETTMKSPLADLIARDIASMPNDSVIIYIDPNMNQQLKMEFYNKLLMYSDNLKNF